MESFETQLSEIILRNYNVKSFRFRLLQDHEFQAGQFMQVTIPVNGQPQSKYFSISNAPTEKGYLEFTKKMTGSDYSNALESLKPGALVGIKMPMGKFVLDKGEDKVAFLAGGIGITPIRSIWKDALDQRWQGSMVLFYSNRTPQDIVFREDLEMMAETARNFKLVLSLDTKAACPLDWKGKCGFISADMIREELPDYGERTFYVCGPPVMVQHMIDMLQGKLQVPDTRIRRENFSGY